MKTIEEIMGGAHTQLKRCGYGQVTVALVVDRAGWFTQLFKLALAAASAIEVSMRPSSKGGMQTYITASAQGWKKILTLFRFPTKSSG